jgi:hypothetical protein
MDHDHNQFAFIYRKLALPGTIRRMPDRLTQSECETLLQFSRSGPGGTLDQQALARLFTLGMIELRQTDRRLVMTEEGQRVCELLKDGWRPTSKSKKSG